MDVDPLLKAIPSCPCFEGKACDAWEESCNMMAAKLIFVIVKIFYFLIIRFN